MACSDKQVSPGSKGPFLAAVRGNERIGERFQRIRLEFSGAGAEAFGRALAGQFAQLDLSEVSVPSVWKIPADLCDASRRSVLLRRPFSFSDVSIDDDKTFVQIIYCVVGPSSLRMTSLSAGDSVSVIGPLGNGFSVAENKTTALLVSGGMGAGPLMHLATVLQSEYPDIEATVFIGAKSGKESLFKLPVQKANEQGLLPADFLTNRVEWVLDNGPEGHRGLVTERLETWLDESPVMAGKTVIYSCGPEAMLAKVAEIAGKRRIECQVSMERRMACGIGLCQSCAVECRSEDSNETIYKMCCKDGPVFAAKEVVF